MKKEKRLVWLNCLSMRMRRVTCQFPRLSLNLKRKRRHRMTSWTARSPVALFNALPAAWYRQTSPCDYLLLSNAPSHPLTLALQEYAGLQLSLNDVVFAADLWNLVLDSTARSDDLPMRPETPPSFLAINFLWFPHVLQTLFLKRTNDTFLDHRTHHFLINTSRNKGGKQPPRSHQQSIWLIHPQVTKSERLWSSLLSVFPLNCSNALRSIF